MKCKKCGTEYEGIYCPICGTKNTDVAETDQVPWYLSLWFIAIVAVLTCGSGTLVMMIIRFVKYPAARKSTVIAAVAAVVVGILLILLWGE